MELREPYSIANRYKFLQLSPMGSFCVKHLKIKVVHKRDELVERNICSPKNQRPTKIESSRGGASTCKNKARKKAAGGSKAPSPPTYPIALGLSIVVQGKFPQVMYHQ